MPRGSRNRYFSLSCEKLRGEVTMTTYSKDTQFGPKYRTDFHLIYRIKDGALEPYGCSRHARRASVSSSGSRRSATEVR